MEEDQVAESLGSPVLIDVMMNFHFECVNLVKRFIFLAGKDDNTDQAYRQNGAEEGQTCLFHDEFKFTINYQYSQVAGPALLYVL